MRGNTPPGSPGKNSRGCKGEKAEFWGFLETRGRQKFGGASQLFFPTAFKRLSGAQGFGFPPRGLTHQRAAENGFYTGGKISPPGNRGGIYRGENSFLEGGKFSFPKGVSRKPPRCGRPFSKRVNRPLWFGVKKGVYSLEPGKAPGAFGEARGLHRGFLPNLARGGNAPLLLGAQRYMGPLSWRFCARRGFRC